MLEDGNCLFRAVADQVYGDSEEYDMARQMCIDYMVILLFILFFLTVHCSSSWSFCCGWTST